MNILDKLKYGLIRLLDEFIDKEDYWHIKLHYRQNNQSNLSKYHLDISKKANFPFTLRNGVPIVTINNKETEFAITVFNYGLGLIDSGVEKNKEKIHDIINWAVSNQQSNGSWLIKHDVAYYKLKSGWVSGMAQGLGISFLIRCIHFGLLDPIIGKSKIDSALHFMISDSIVNRSTGFDIIEEYAGSKTNVLNGFIFSLFALWDYGVIYDDYTAFYHFENSLADSIKKYSFFIWSYYDNNGTITSRFYHGLHIEMLKWLTSINERPIYKKLLRRWKIGNYFFFIFISLKSIQKFSKLSSLDTLDTK